MTVDSMGAPRPSILISGCSSGIGLATAHRLADQGWQVFAGLRQVPAERPLAWHPEIELCALDVDDSASIAQAVAQVLARTGGRLDALFNNAGFGQPGAAEDLPRAALRAQFETNVFGAWELTNAVLPTMRRQGQGRVLFNSSLLGYAAMPMRGAYNASKYALEGLADTLRLELQGSGIAVVLIEPGPIRSAFRANALRRFEQHIQAEHSVWRQRYPSLRARLARPDDTSRWTLPAEAVAEQVLRALLARHPAARYRITAPAHAFAWAKRCLPTAWLDRLLLWGHRQEQPEAPASTGV